MAPVHQAPKASERRQHQRREMLTWGKLIFNRPLTVIDCMVRDLSDNGACLEMSQPVQVPDVFELIIKPSSKRRLCGVVWRAEKRIGVEFKQGSLGPEDA
jgi:hypothetical protein